MVDFDIDVKVSVQSRASLRSKRFCLCGFEAITRPIFRAVFDSPSSFFAPKPHGNAFATQASHELLLSLKKAVTFRTPTFDKPSS